MNASSCRLQVSALLVVVCSLSTAVCLAAGGFGGGGLGGRAAGFGAAGFGGGSTSYGGPTAGFGVQPRVAAPIPGQPLAPVGYDGSNVGPSTNSWSPRGGTRSLGPAPQQPRLYRDVSGGPRYDPDDGASSSAAPSESELRGILPPNGSGYLVVEDDEGGATIYGPDGVRRVQSFDRSKLQELTRP